MPETVVAISSTFTAEPTEDSLRFWFNELEIDGQIEFAPYNQVFQQLLDSNSLFSRNKSGLNVILVKLDDWLRNNKSDQLELSISKLESTAQEFLAMLSTVTKSSTAAHLIVSCPYSPAVKSTPDLEKTITRLEDNLSESINTLESFGFITSSELQILYPVKDGFDSETDRLAHIPYKPSVFAALGTLIFRKLFTMSIAAYKVIVVDCDQTLWQGVCAEDGATGVEINESKKALQNFLIEQHNQGKVIALCSKNNKEDVLNVFSENPEMLLELGHVATMRVNWLPKSENLKSIAQELNLGLDSFIFIDDDPVQCAEVESFCPGTLVLQLPDDLNSLKKLIKHVWAFDSRNLTEADQVRTTFYQQQSQRKVLEEEAPSYSEFLKGLDLKVEFIPVTADNVSRLAQLTQRTNQFNFTSLRRSTSEISELLAASHSAILVNVSDRFGNYGIVGGIIYKLDNHILNVESLLLSCRALGRGVEHAMLSELGTIAGRHNVEEVQIAFSATSKNQPAAEFLDSTNPDSKSNYQDRLMYNFAPSKLKSLEFIHTLEQRPSSDRIQGSLPKRDKDLKTSSSAKLKKIYNELSDIDQIHFRVSEFKKQKGDREVSPTALAKTETEKRVAVIWSGVLGLEEVPIDEDFFGLGGHSLSAMQILAEVNVVFDIELPVEMLFSENFTLRNLAKAIDTFCSDLVSEHGDRVTP